MDEQVVFYFHQKMNDERLHGHNEHETELRRLYSEILLGMVANYGEYRKHVPKFLRSLETNNPHSVSYSIKLFFELYEQLILTDEFENFDLSILNQDGDDNIFEKIFSILKAGYTKNNQQRISEDNFDISSLSDEEKKNIASLIISKLQDDSKNLNWDNEMVESTMMQLIFLRQILCSLDVAELFYYVIGILFDRLTSSEFYQAGRDIAEEIIFSSYKSMSKK